MSLIPYAANNVRAMIFVDGENLAIRYGALLRERNEQPKSDIEYEPGIFVWKKNIDYVGGQSIFVVRKYYYTALQGDFPLIEKTEERLKGLEFESPRVFKRIKDRDSKQVDIALATDMLTHAFRKHYDVAILVAGDEDYVPLVRAVQGEGARVYDGFFLADLAG
jgi:uncharacterized LabA/DUF88 family protein